MRPISEQGAAVYFTNAMQAVRKWLSPMGEQYIKLVAQKKIWKIRAGFSKHAAIINQAIRNRATARALADTIGKGWQILRAL